VILLARKFERVVFIAEPNDAFRDYLVRKVRREMRAKTGGDSVLVSAVREATAVDLFGGVHVYSVSCPLKQDAEVAVKTLQNCRTEPWGGLIISTGAPLNSLRGILKSSEKMGVTVIKPTASKNRVRHELEKAGLPRPVINFMAEHAGEELRLIVRLLDFVATISDEEKKQLTIHDVDRYIPMEPGTRAPWDILDALVKKDIARVNSIIDRAGSGATFPVAVLKSKISDTLRVASYLEVHPEAKLSDVVTALGGSTWSLKEPYNLSRRVKLQGILAIANDLQSFLRNPYRSYTVEEFKRFCLALCM
jgi:DNA polymerase III delta subunit